MVFSESKYFYVFVVFRDKFLFLQKLHKLLSEFFSVRVIRDGNIFYIKFADIIFSNPPPNSS